jgi:hypothetical protein
MGTAVNAQRADSGPKEKPVEVGRLPRKAAVLYAETFFFPQPTRWLEIPWLLDLNEGIGLAKQENRPVLIWVSGDDPLERC